VPNLGGWINRMPTYQITRHPPSSDEEQGTTTDEADVGMSDENKLQQRPALNQLRPFTSMSSVLPGPRYAVLPEDHGLEGWTREDFMELNDHVRHMLHSRRSKFKRSMKGFGQYVRKRTVRYPQTLRTMLIHLQYSTGIPRYSLRNPDYSVWSRMGAFLDRYELALYIMAPSHQITD
jgi:hypothetical protein